MPKKREQEAVTAAETQPPKGEYRFFTWSDVVDEARKTMPIEKPEDLLEFCRTPAGRLVFPAGMRVEQAKYVLDNLSRKIP